MSRRFKYDRPPYDLSTLAADNIDRLTLERIPRGSRVLELGCATGYQTQYLQEQLGCQVVAVDLSPEALNFAAKFAQKTLAGNLDDETFWKKIAAQGSFDVVLASNVVEHLANTTMVLESIRRVLKPSGQLVVSIPNIAWWRSRVRLLQGIWKYESYGLFDETHARFFSLPSFRSALEAAGLKVTDEAYDPAGGAKWLTPLLKRFPNAYAYQAVFVTKPQTKRR